MLAELAIADTQFARGNYTEAIDSYKSFSRLHPTHEKVEDGYVAFRIGECYYKDMPDDIWLLPPSYEKDQSAVIDALRELDDFRKKFPDSPYMKKADELRKRGAEAPGRPRGLRRALLPRAATTPRRRRMRLEGAIKRYPGSGREPELLFSLGETYLHMGDPPRAKETLRARGRRVRRRAAGAPVGAVSRVHRASATATNPQPTPPPRARAPPRPAPSPPNG